MNKSLVLKSLVRFLAASGISSCGISQGKIISVNWPFATGSLSEPPKKNQQTKIGKKFHGPLRTRGGGGVVVLVG